MNDDAIIVPGCGRVPNAVMVVGEAPGETEAARGEPFVGKAGKEQDRYLALAGWSSGVRTWYRTNLVKEYVPGNPDPTPAQVAAWTPVLVDEIRKVRPLVIIAVGAHATRWFLGDAATMELVHGLPHRAGAFDEARRERAPLSVVLPVYHPAAGFYDNDVKALIQWDYTRAVEIIRQISDPEAANYGEWVAHDEYAGRETYLDAGGIFLTGYLARVPLMSLDTEGTPDAPWSIQVAIKPGTACVLRRSNRYFDTGIAAIQRAVDSGATIVVHNAMYDIAMCRAMGLDLSCARLFDTQYAAYIMRLEPQGLKPLAYRWCGMIQPSYSDVVGDIGIEKQLAYLGRVLEEGASRPGGVWPPPEPRIQLSNDGTARVYKPQPVERRVEAILVDWYSGKVDKDGARVDPYKRWRQVDGELRAMVERELGPMPIGTLDDIPLDAAVRYAARDADATLRLYHRMIPALRAQKLDALMATGMEVLPVFEEMQANGMPASRSHFESLAAEMTATMERIQSRISHRWFGGRPFNPASHVQVATLMRRRGLEGEKRTSTGKMSTSKKSIEHLRYEDDAMAAVIDWREHAKVRDAFCTPVLELLNGGGDIGAICGSIKPTRVTSRRLAMADPNLLAIPVRNELGKRVRDGYCVPEGELFGSWDLSQIEMRYMAHLSRDPLLIRFFHEKRDVHRETAARIFGIKLADVKELEHRYPAKRAGFGIITNITGHGLVDQLRMFGCQGWTEESCDELIEEWLNIYAGVRDFLEACRREVRERGVVYDHWGMPRYLPGVWGDDAKTRAESERAASSHKIQGGAQGMIQSSMRWLRPYIAAMQAAGENVRWRLQIHDEIILSFDEALWETLDPLVREALTQHSGIRLSVPVEASGSKSRTWGGLK